MQVAGGNTENGRNYGSRREKASLVVI
jgi:hypothetical protein